MKNTSDQKGRKLRSTTSINSLFKDARLKKQIEKVGGSYKCNLCKKSFIKKEEVRFHFFIFHNCCQTNSHEAQNLTTHNPPEKQNGADSNITLANVSNNKSKPSSDKTLSKEILEKEITKGLLNYADSNKTKVLEVKTLKCSDKKSDENHQNDSNTKLTAKDNCKVKAEKNDEFPKSDDGIEETHDWSVFIKDLKKNKRHSKLFDGITDTPEKQNVVVSNITLTNVSNSHSISSSDETISGKILEKRITQILTNVQSEKSYEKNNIPIYSFATPISVKSKSQRRKKEKNVQMKKDLNNLEDQVVDVLITPESDLPSNDEILSEERLLNKVHDKSNVNIIEDSNFSKFYNNTLKNLEMSAKSGITNFQTLKIKIPKNINRPLELIRDIPDSPERKKMKMIQNIILEKDVNDSKGEAGPSKVRRVEKEDLEILKTLCTKPCVHQSKNDKIHNSPEKQSGDVSNFSFVKCVFCGLKNCPIEVQRLEVQRFEEEEEDEESANTPRHEEEVKETAKDARQQKGQKGKKSKNHNMKISKDTSKMLLILKCHKCSKEFDSTFELYKHQNRRHKVKFANSYSYLNDFQNFSLKKIMTKKLNDGTENTGLYIDTINIYNGHNQENICGRKKLENWVQLGVYTYLF
jgi:ribosomal protein L44E